MKPFNLEEYLKNPKRKVVTRLGRDVRIICTDANLELHPIIALVKGHNNEKEFIVNYTKDGSAVEYNNAYYQLFFAPEKHEGWVNVYRDFDGLMCGSVFATEEDAKCNAKTAIATIKIEWEE